ncbi:hypothetical protein TcWFU_000607 [Taenia crassiceps]|uniref:Uncharacterized protein n=1 Tax=Taenia crassiceps TaxID=6207 RepID=A0ABR4QA51_9CEST
MALGTPERPIIYKLGTDYQHFVGGYPGFSSPPAADILSKGTSNPVTPQKESYGSYREVFQASSASLVLIAVTARGAL